MEHITKRAFRYLKMALSREGEAVRAFKVFFSEVTLSVIPRISGKKIDVKKLNGSQEVKERRK